MPSDPASALKPLDSLVVDVITDDVSDTYVSKTLFAVSEFSNVVLAGGRYDREKWRPRRSPREPRDVQRACRPAQERRGRAGCQRAAPRRARAARCAGGQRSQCPAAARRSLLLQRRDPPGDLVREMPRGPSL